jgi:hypothetical protein
MVPTRTKRSYGRVLFAAAGLLLLLVLVLPIAAALVLKPMAREKVIELLEERFDGVELESLDIQLMPRLRPFPAITAEGKGLSLRLKDRAEAPPFVEMDVFSARMSLAGLLRDPIRVERLDLDELRIQIPPKRQEEEAQAEPRKEPPPKFVIEELLADGAVLRILPRDPEKQPLQFDLHQLRVESAGVGEPMRFDAVLDNAKPPGTIDTTGSFGPLSIENPGASPVSGEYVFENADLSVFKGIAGTLHSEGRFQGLLERIEVEGFTDTPDFQLQSAGNPVQLRTDFAAVVDGTKGNTFLVPVRAALESSKLETQGGVSELPGEDGKTVCVDARSADARIEDFLRLTMDSETPFMSGAVTFQSMVLIPPGDIDVVQKLVLDGEFQIDSAVFPEPKVQEKVEQLSEVGKGKDPKAKAVESLREERVLSDIRGRFELSKGVMTLSSVSFRVPGAQVDVAGTYGLLDRRIDLLGEVKLDAKLSETTSGIKSFFLKLVDPLFQKDDAGAVIPIRIGGTADQPSFGLAVGRLIDRQPIADATGRKVRTCESLLDLEETANGAGGASGPRRFARSTESSAEKSSAR